MPQGWSEHVQQCFLGGGAPLRPPCAHTSVSLQSCPSAAETCRRMSEFIKKPKWQWDVFHCFQWISWNGSQLRLQTTTCPLLFTVIVTEIDAMSENQWGWERGVSEEGDERFSLQHPSTKPKGGKNHILFSCGGHKGFALKGFHAPTVGQIASTDPGRITQEPICVR